MRIVPLLPVVALIACDVPTDTAELGGGWTVTWHDEDGSFDLAGPSGQRLDAVRIELGAGTETVSFNEGSFRFDDVTDDVRRVDGLRPGEGDEAAGRVLLVAGERVGVILPDAIDGLADDGLGLRIVRDGAVTTTPRVRLSAACDADDHFLGLGSHAMDVDHVGEAFPLWVSEPGIGKNPTDEPADNWFLVGTKHASSYPVPFLLRPHQGEGLLVRDATRVEVDLCKRDPGRFVVEAWSQDLSLALLAGDGPLGVVQDLNGVTGRPRRLPRWALAPWNDAIRGADRVREVARTLREAGAPSSVIWTEDWKGGNQTGTGYRLTEDWHVDRALYPEVEDLAAELGDAGFKWFAYFAPFLGMDTPDAEDAVAAGATIHDDAGATYTFLGVTFAPTTVVDVSGEAGRAWARARMQAAVDLGFDGWMADYGEWLPTDAVVASGDGGYAAHQRYPGQWQAISEAVLAPVDGLAFCRSGWSDTSGVCPVTWVGDQRTDFQTDDGLPSVLPLMLGLSASGVPVTTHDVAGYQSLTNPNSTKELWFRWAALGAFSPILRTHHGSSDTGNHQFDRDAETLAFWVRMAKEHTRLFPYLDALAAEASEAGTPMVLPTSFLFDGEPYDRADAWMLGRSLLVAPVLAEGATARDVALPAGVAWYDWWTGAPATSGAYDVPLDAIPVFAAAGTTVPLFDVVPDTLADTTDEALVSFDEADGTRLLLVFGDGGAFREGDGTTYTPTGTATGAAEVTATLTSGTVEVGGLSVAIAGPRERTYRVRVVR